MKNRAAVISAMMHVLLLAALVSTRRLWITPTLLPGSAQGTQRVLTYLPGRTASSTNLPVKVAVKKPAPRTPLDAVALPVKKTEETVASTDAPIAAKPDGQTGNDGLGSGNVNIALVRNFPTPKPDLSKLPRGTSGDVVVDVVIGEDGKVSSLTMLHGVGYGVDETVLATVQQWVFQPATQDGKPIASEQELHFHYEKA